MNMFCQLTLNTSTGMAIKVATAIRAINSLLKPINILFTEAPVFFGSQFPFSYCRRHKKP
jgi:hypothetical protein